MKEFVFECVDLMDIHMWWILPSSVIISVLVVFILNKKGLL